MILSSKHKICIHLGFLCLLVCFSIISFSSKHIHIYLPLHNMHLSNLFTSLYVVVIQAAELRLSPLNHTFSISRGRNRPTAAVSHSYRPLVSQDCIKARPNTYIQTHIKFSHCQKNDVEIVYIHMLICHSK